MARKEVITLVIAVASVIGLLRISASAFAPAASSNGVTRTPTSLRGVSAASQVGTERSVSRQGATAAALPFAGGLLLVATCLRAAQGATRRQHQRSLSAVQMGATRTDWYRKVKRVGGDMALFDVTIKKPMGLKMEVFPQEKKAGIGVSEVVEGGNAAKLNREVCVQDAPGMWVLEGDRVMAVNGTDVEFGTIEDIVAAVSSSDSDEVTLTLMRNTRKGPIKVVLMPSADMVTVRRNSRLSAAAEYCAGKELTYGCIDGWCGVCWHREKFTNGVFKPCSDVLTGDWDNVMPLVLTPKPERAGDSTLLKPRGV